ncbi:MAG: ParB/RepB/Spo0J family partition protein [Bilifractor sp.]
MYRNEAISQACQGADKEKQRISLIVFFERKTKVAAKRGLNKAKGLSSLIPQNYSVEKKNSEQGNIEKKAVPGENSGFSASSEQPGYSSSDSPDEPSGAIAYSDNKSKDPEEVNEISVSSGKNDISPQNSGNDPDENTSDGVVELRISEIVPNKDQPRQKFDEKALDELADSIRQFGVIQPLLVQKNGKYYEIIAGERRWRAARKAGLKTVPAVIRDFSERETVEVSLIENIQRQDLNAIEEAKAYKRLIEEFSMTQEEISARVSKSRPSIANSLRLLNLEPAVQEMVSDGTLSSGHARALLGLSEPELQRKAAEEVVRGDLSVRETELLVKELVKPTRERKERAVNEQLEAVYRDMENQLSERFGTRVRILHGRGKRGKIEIEYYSREDLDRIIDTFR